MIENGIVAESLAAVADRILKGIDSRVSRWNRRDRGLFASDLMVDKVRDIMTQLEELEDAVRVEDLQSRLKTIEKTPLTTQGSPGTLRMAVI